ncbi:NAD-dependent epimerase/dehydratase family protein [Neolewinella persica]|uniref:NAD-dependent epimerase/dehydratase family protein n=1 Tax=Neolewinella persica TaxID=70998 RepID=UPI0004777D61|nr:NAD-dependent epimerase/dehydratase family protein [Neolewinella persica]
MKIAIIGGAGFIGSHVTQRFLDAGHRVRVSATRPEDTARYAHLHQLPGASERLEIVQLDLLKADQLPVFLEGQEIVVHSGTPFQLAFQDAAGELLDPTITGTKNLLAAVAKNPAIKQLVVVASVAAHNTHFPLDVPGREGQVISEADKPYFSDQDHPYAQAKYLADQEVRKFVETYAGDCSVVSVSPVGVMGKPLSDREDSTSMGMQHLLRNKIAPDEFFQLLYDMDAAFAVVDVQDVARGICSAATTPGLHGRHFLLSAESYPISDLTLMLNGKAPAGGPRTVYDAGASKRMLGMEYAPATNFLGQPFSRL